MKVLLHRLIGWFEFPHRLLAVRSAVRRPGAQLLDAGCGNHSPSITKRFFPDVEYSGIDNSDWNRDVGDAAAIDHFYELSLDDEAVLAKVPDDRFDAVVCSHVLEHLQDPTMTANALVRKLRPGGLAYFEVPSPRTVDWPRAKDGWWGIRGCLNFYDDPTHVAPVDLSDIASSLRSEGHVVTGPKRRRLARRVVLFPAYAAAGLVTRRYIPASVVWDITGFADSIVVRRGGRPIAPRDATKDTVPSPGADASRRERHR